MAILIKFEITKTCNAMIEAAKAQHMSVQNESVSYWMAVVPASTKFLRLLCIIIISSVLYAPA